MDKITVEQLVEAQLPQGGWTNEQLAEWGVSLPPKKGWIQDLVGKNAYRKFRKRKRKALRGEDGSRAKKRAITKAAKDEFLQCYAWRKLRYEVIQEQGARCLACGRTPTEGIQINVDHIKPRKFYPELALDKSNLQILCHECNHGKGNWDQTDWRSHSPQETR